MAIRIAINGYGRIGRCVLRALYESGYRERVQIVGINELSDLDSLVHLTRFDSTHCTFTGQVSQDDGSMIVNGDVIAISNERDMSCLPWPVATSPTGCIAPTNCSRCCLSVTTWY